LGWAADEFPFAIERDIVRCPEALNKGKVMVNGSTRAVVDGFLAAYAARDAHAAAALYAVDGSHREVATGHARIGRQDIEDGLARFMRCFPDAIWTTKHLIVEGNAAAVAYMLTGTLSAKLGPFEPDGQCLRLEGLHLLEVADGCIRSTVDYWDTGTFARQMRPEPGTRSAAERD
jgi:steroid delta-isomerase-like uncharacterized protein